MNEQWQGSIPNSLMSTVLSDVGKQQSRLELPSEPIIRRLSLFVTDLLREKYTVIYFVSSTEYYSISYSASFSYIIS